VLLQVKLLQVKLLQAKLLERRHQLLDQRLRLRARVLLLGLWLASMRYLHWLVLLL
jgi:hypothetical protein